MVVVRLHNYKADGSLAMVLSGGSYVASADGGCGLHVLQHLTT